MNGTASKASAREIRKAFGPQAVDEIEQLRNGLVHHTVVLQQQANQLNGLDASVITLIPLLTVDGGFRGIETLYRLKDRGLLGRLKWLVFGR